MKTKYGESASSKCKLALISNFIALFYTMKLICLFLAHLFSVLYFSLLPFTFPRFFHILFKHFNWICRNILLYTFFARYLRVTIGFRLLPKWKMKATNFDRQNFVPLSMNATVFLPFSIFHHQKMHGIWGSDESIPTAMFPSFYISCWNRTFIGCSSNIQNM